MSDSPVVTNNDDQLVEHQLAQILASPYFKSAQQMQKFLKYVVRKTLANQEKQLKQYTIAVEGLSLPTDFDSDNNPLIRIIAGRVRERLDKYYKKEGLDDPLVISITKGSYIPGFHKKGRTLVSEKVTEGISTGPKLALICFSDKTQNKTSNRLLLQITDILAKELSHFLFTRLIVAIPYADKSESGKSAMKEKFDADYVLSLYIHQLPDNKYELLYRLLSTDPEEVLWSESYELDNTIAINKQFTILAKIIATIADLQQGILFIHWSRRLLENEKTIPKHYQALVYYRHYSDYLDRATFAKGVEIVKQALERSTNDVVANIIYADYCRREYVYDYGVIESPLVVGKQCAETAVSLKANSHEAHYVMGQILFCLKEWDSCLDEFDLARNISKYHTSIEYGAGFHICLTGQWEKGMALVNRAMSLSSSYPTWFHLIPSLNFYRQGRFEDALFEAKKILSKSLLHGPLARCVSYAQLGKKEKAHVELEEVIKRYPPFMTNGKQMLMKFFGNEELTEKVWDGVLKAK